MMKTGLSAPRSIGDVLTQLESLGDSDSVTIGEILGSYGQKSFLPTLMIPALIVTSPLSGVPLLSSICGLTIAATAAQWLTGRDRIWMPAFLARRKVSGPRLKAGAAKLEGLGRWLDSRSHERFSPLLRRPLRWFLPLACMLAGLAMPFLEFVPLTSSILGLAVLLIGGGVLMRDGLFAAVGLTVMALAASIPLSLLL
ncbi:exopolysaccharide biosynthesis protein [Oceanibium sediminis]|uniref:exopolysaccharide biosynthesis protein n=1 Tax=Oceanibium sediminis TaxID=2026339 RepID=UPI001E41CC32|nr:exopolysaccharide biosynthesis protein [Oceanibium sediminis]